MALMVSSKKGTIWTTLPAMIFKKGLDKATNPPYYSVVSSKVLIRGV